jgi:hypothetical protein
MLPDGAEMCGGATCHGVLQRAAPRSGRFIRALARLSCAAALDLPGPRKVIPGLDDDEAAGSSSQGRRMYTATHTLWAKDASARQRTGWSHAKTVCGGRAYRRRQEHAAGKAARAGTLAHMALHGSNVPCVHARGHTCPP